MTDNFEEVMSRRTDAELSKIVAGPEGDYQPAALEAAKKEFARRNLSADMLVTAKQEIETDRKQIDQKANIPLEIKFKVLTLLIPGAIQLIFSGAFRAKGYERKADELVRWTLYGFGFYIILVLLISNLN